MPHSFAFSDSSIDSNETENDVFDTNRNAVTPQYELTAGSHGWGPAIIYRIKENGDCSASCIPVCIPEHYEYRGEDLKNLNRIEYYCLVETRTLLSEKNSNKKGRKSSTQYKYGTGFRLQATHAQFLRSKQHIPVHTGQIPKPPRYPIPEPNAPSYPCWLEKANQFGAYYLAAFRAEEHNFDDENRDHDLQYDWDTFYKWFEELKHSNDFISKARVDMINSTINGLTTDNESKMLLSKYRQRARDVWNAQETLQGQQYRNANDRNEPNVVLDEVDDYINSANIKCYSGRQLRELMGITQYSDNMIGTLEKLTRDGLTRTTSLQTSDSPLYGTNNPNIEREIQIIAESIELEESNEEISSEESFIPSCRIRYYEISTKIFAVPEKH